MGPFQPSTNLGRSLAHNGRPTAMRILRAILCALISLGAAACSNDRDVTDVQFGSFSGVGTGKVRFQATTTLSKKEGLHLGWLFSVRSHPGQVVTVQETVEGPPGTAWEAPPSASEVQVTDGGRTATVTRVSQTPVRLSRFTTGPCLSLTRLEEAGPRSSSMAKKSGKWSSTSSIDHARRLRWPRSVPNLVDCQAPASS